MEGGPGGPEAALRVLRAAVPALLALGAALEATADGVQRVWEAAAPVRSRVAHFHPVELAQIFGGLALLFFGGTFATTVAAFEAFRLCGYGQLRTCAVKLWDNYLIACDASAKDDRVDADGDGVADVKQLSGQQLASRKLRLLLKVVDPEQVAEALAGLWAGFSAVIAALKIKFARAVTFGATLGDLLFQASILYVRPAFQAALDPSVHKWITPAVRYASRSLGVLLAFAFQRVISALHSSVRGAELALAGAARLLAQRGVRLPVEVGSPLFHFAAWILAAIGFYHQASDYMRPPHREEQRTDSKKTQVAGGFRLGFPMNVLLLPVSVIDWSLTQLVAVST